MKSLISTVAAIAVAIAIWGLSVTAVLAAKFTYPWFSKGLVNTYDLTADQMQQNYDAVIDYSLYPWVKELQFPTLPMSDGGSQHFVEAKGIFQIFVQGGFWALILSVILGIYLWRRYRTASFLTAGGVIALVTPVVLSVPILMNFDRAFVIFHQIVFNNDLWIFDGDADPIINYLPESLFMRNAIAIVVLMILLAVIALICGRRLKRRIDA